DRPMTVIMSSGESKAAPTVGPLDGPSNGLRLLLAGDRRVQNGHPAFVAVAKTNVVVVLFVELEWRQPARDRMLRRSGSRLRLGILNLGEPMIRRTACFIVKESADPFQKLRAAALRWHEDRVVDRDQPAAALHLLADFLEPVILQNRMIFLSVVRPIAEQHDRVGVIQRALIRRPAVQMNLGLYSRSVRRSIEALLDQPHPQLILVMPWPMTFRAGNQHDLL